MTKSELERIISKGEGLTVEFKLCEGSLTNSVFETVSSFSNRYGGHIVLGMEDNGKIIGVNKNSVDNIKNNFINTLNNPQRFSPTQFLSLEEIEIDGKLLLWVYVPVNSQVVMFAGKIYDRAEGGDIDVSKNSNIVSQLHTRKSHEYSERKLFPYAKMEDFEFERLMPKVRLLAQNRMPDHPWKTMSDMDILKSAGLYQEDRETNKLGFNLAAILLFGKEEVIRSCTANYLTDAICRKENLDRYDDRLIVSVNLIDAYEQLIDFIAKHTLDRFFLIEDQSVSIRSKIAREIISNSLMHREYSSAFPAKIIIGNEEIVTENWNLPKNYGTINPKHFTPYPKNPIIANFFINIGRADALGSGVRNLYKFTKIYSGQEPKLVEGDIFKTFVPIALNKYVIENVPENDPRNVNDPENVPENDPRNGNDPENVPENDPENDPINGNDPENDPENRFAIIMDLIKNNVEISMLELSKTLNVSHKTIKRDIQTLKAKGLIERVGANKGGYWRIKKIR